jgi:hypothetical protein
MKPTVAEPRSTAARELHHFYRLDPGCRGRLVGELAAQPAAIRSANSAWDCGAALGGWSTGLRPSHRAIWRIDSPDRDLLALGE